MRFDMRFDFGRTEVAVWLLALGQTLSYAGVYYAFPALLPDLIAQMGWRVADLAFGPTLGFLVMAALIPISGRLLDRGYGGWMMVLGPILGAACLVGLGFVAAIWQWNALWLLIGVAQAGCLYETCFALLTRSLEGAAQPALTVPAGLTARGAITRITLIAGFSSTLSFPLGRLLAGAGQTAFVFFAGLVLMAAVINFAAIRLLHLGTAAAPVPPATKPHLRAILGRRAFWSITAIFSAIWLSHGILLTYVLLLFEHQGAGVRMATFAAASIGPAQVAARLILLSGEARISNARATIWALSSIVLAGVLLRTAGAAPGLIFAFAAFQGAGAGLLSILRPVLVADFLGRANFGAISAAVSVGPIVATAAAPAVGAALMLRGGAAMILSVSLGLAVAALLLGLLVLRNKESSQ